MSSPSLLIPGLDLSFLSNAYDGGREQSRQQPVEKENSSAGRVKKCRQRKVKCDRQSNCANCRLHHKRCYYVDAKPVASSAEDELVAAREKIDRLRALVKLLMQGAAKNNGGGDDLSSPSYASASSSSYGGSDGDFPVLTSPSFSSPYDLPSQASLLPPLPYSSSPPTLALPPFSTIAPSYTAELSAAYPLPPPPLPPMNALLPPLPVVAGLPSFEFLPPEFNPVLSCS